MKQDVALDTSGGLYESIALHGVEPFYAASDFNRRISGLNLPSLQLHVPNPTPKGTMVNRMLTLISQLRKPPFGTFLGVFIEAFL
jgi:hypothetical protein